MGRALHVMATCRVMAKDYDGAMKKGLEALDLLRGSDKRWAEGSTLKKTTWQLDF